MICVSLVSTVCGLLLAAIVISTTSNPWKLCCDLECKEPISYARTTSRNVKRDNGYLAFPENAKIVIYAKDVTGDKDIWEGELYGKRGLVKSSLIEELTVNCPTPQHWVAINKIETTPPSLNDVPFTQEDNKGEGEGLHGNEDTSSYDEDSETESDSDHHDNHLDEWDGKESEATPIEEIDNETTHPYSEGIHWSDSHTAESDSNAAESDSHTAESDSHTAESDSHTAESDSHTAEPDSHTAEPDSGFDSEDDLDVHVTGTETTTVDISELSESETFIPIPSESQTSILTPSDFETSIPITSESQTSIPTPSEFETSIPIPSESQTSIPTPSEFETSIPTPSEFETSIPIPSESQTSTIPTPLEFGTSSESIPIPSAEFETPIPIPSKSETSIPIPSEFETPIPIPSESETSIPIPSESETSIPIPSESETPIPIPSESQTPISIQSSSSSIITSQSLDTPPSMDTPPVHTPSRDVPSRSHTPLSHLSSIMKDRTPLVSDTSTNTPLDTPSDTPMDTPTLHHRQNKPRDPKWEEDVPVMRKYTPPLDQQDGDDTSFVKRDKKYFIDLISDKFVSFLPSSFAEWALLYGPDTGLVAIVTTAVAMILPLCCTCISARRRASKASRLLNAEMSRKKNTDAFLTNIRNRVAKLEKENDQLDIEVAGLKEQLEVEKQGNWDLENTRNTLEQEKDALTRQLVKMEEEMTQTKYNLKRVTTELEQALKQTAAVLEEKGHALLQMTQSNSQLEKAVLDSQELEAAKLQLEQDCYTTRVTLDEVKGQLNQLQGDKDTLTNENQRLLAEVGTLSENVGGLQCTLTEKDKELEALKECVLQMTQEEGGGSNDGEDKLQIVKDLLNTTKARSELSQVSQERDGLRLELLEQESVLDQTRNENQTLQEEIKRMAADQEQLRQAYQTTEMKLKAITEYFEQKETHLHRKIGEEEIVRQRVESREAYAKERAEHAETEREKEREELKELRKQMGDIEKSLMQQVVTNEKRAEEALSQLRRTEQELRAANKEVTALKRRLEDIRHSPSPPGLRPPMRSLPPPDMRRSPHPPMPSKPLPPGYRPGYGPRPPFGGPPGPMGLPPRPHPPRPMGPPPGPMGAPPPSGPPPPRSSSPIEGRSLSDHPLVPRPRSAVNEGIRGYYSDEASRSSRQTPPGMESHDPYRPRPDYPPHPPRDDPGRQSRPLSRSSLNNSLDDSHNDRPPIPGNHGYPPPRPYAPRDPYYRPRPPHERPRPPSGPQYTDMSRSFDRQRDYPPSQAPPTAMNHSTGHTSTSSSAPTVPGGPALTTPTNNTINDTQVSSSAPPSQV